jgi:predicted nucleic acid-binding protein
MIKAHLDTVIIVDLLRGYLPAIRWVQTQTELGVSQIVVLEVLAGADNKVEMERARKRLNSFELVEVVPPDLDWAAIALSKYKLSHGVGMMDCLIAAPCARVNVPLYTHNLKHFAPLIGALAQTPY